MCRAFGSLPDRILRLDGILGARQRLIEAYAAIGAEVDGWLQEADSDLHSDLAKPDLAPRTSRKELQAEDGGSKHRHRCERNVGLFTLARDRQPYGNRDPAEETDGHEPSDAAFDGVTNGLVHGLAS